MTTTRTVRYAAAATVLMSLMNLPFAFEDGGTDIPAPMAWLVTLLGVAGLAAAIALLRKASWGPWAVTAIGAVNLVGAVVALVGNRDGALFGLTLSAVITVLGAVCAGGQAARRTQPAGSP